MAPSLRMCLAFPRRSWRRSSSTLRRHERNEGARLLEHGLGIERQRRRCCLEQGEQGPKKARVHDGVYLQGLQATC
eukprot:12794932-Ditylum_brightwellii.AAC.1